MKLSTGKRIGQSGQELLTAAVFSFVLHACAVAAVALFYISASPRVHIPPFYQVKLVGEPAGTPSADTSPQAAPPAAAHTPPAERAPHKTKPVPKAKRAAAKQPKPRAKAARNAVPELSRTKPKPERHEPEKTVEQPREQAASQQATGPAAASSSGVKSESGAVTTSGGPQDFNQKFAWYLKIVSDKIGQNWKPTPDTPDARVRVTFKLNRSGWVEDLNIIEEQSRATYGFKLAAMRAIRSSSPFGGLPDEFGRQTLELTVDLSPEE